MRKSLTVLQALALATLLTGPGYAQEPKELRIVVPDDMLELEPCEMASSGVSRIIQQNVVETLVNVDPTSGELKPRLATEWEQVAPDTYRFKLREGVKFQDGSDFNAASVAHTFERQAKRDLECLTSDKYFSGLTVSTSAVDDHTVDIKIDPPQPLLPLLMTQVAMVPESAPLDSRIAVPIGTGPYTITSADPGQQSVLERNPGYWGTPPEADKVTFIYRGDSAVAAAMVQTGEAELAPYIARSDATDTSTDVSYPNTDTLYMNMTLNTPPLTDIRVRKAINYAIDRNAFIGTVLGEGVIPASQLVLPFIAGYNDELQPWPYDPEEAKKLLAEAKADGVPVDKEIYVYGTPYLFQGLTDVASVVSQMLDAAGFKTKVQIVEKAQWSELLNPPHLGPDERQAGVFLNTHDNAGGDAGTTLYYKYSSKPGISEIVDAELDQLIDEGLTQSGDERAATFAKAFARDYNDIVGNIPLFHLVGYARVSPKISWTPNSLTHTQVPVENITFK